VTNSLKVLQGCQTHGRQRQQCQHQQQQRW
jgi:hypothetical protein